MPGNRSRRTVNGMELGAIDTPGVALLTPARPEPRRAGAIRPVSSDVAADASRMTRVVELIELVSGRDVKLVPPVAYLVSPPRAQAPERAVELTFEAAIDPEDDSDGDPLVVDVTSVLREGTSDRMILRRTADGELALSPGLNLEL